MVRKIILNENQIPMLTNEALIRFGSGENGNVTILAGGGGSGKGFILKHIVDTTNSKIFNPDKFKNLIINSEKLLDSYNNEFFNSYGYGINEKTFQDTKFTNDLHQFIKNKKFYDKSIEYFLKGSLLLKPERKPNMVFDITMKDVSDLRDIGNMVIEAGYLKENINVIWVLNSLEQALIFNKKRERNVPDKILVNAHNKVSETIRYVLDDYGAVSDVMDGELWVVFANELIHNKKKYIEKINKINLKKKGQPPSSVNNLSKEIISKIKNYVPNKEVWK